MMKLVRSKKMAEFTGQYFPDVNTYTTYARNDTQVSKKYYLDERGRLVAPNGTRYRLPSGPPEGRRPFQLDRSQPEKHSIKPHIPSWISNKNLSRDNLFPEQQDANKLLENKFRKESNDLAGFNSNKLAHLNSTSISKTSPLKIPPSQMLGPPISVDLNPDLLQSVDWNVVLLTLILSSISLICNVALLIFLSWKVCQVKGYQKSNTPSARLNEPNPQSWKNPHCESYSGPLNRTQMEQIPPSKSLPKCHCVFEITGGAANSNLSHSLGLPGGELNTLSDSWCTNRIAKNHRRSCHLSKCPGSKRKRRIKDSVNHSRHCHNRRVRARMSRSWIENPGLGALGKLSPLEKGSSSGGSWQMIASDGILSESTADEADSTPDTTNNSDILSDPNRMRMVEQKFHTRRNTQKTDVICNTISDSNLDQPQGLSTNNGTNVIGNCTSRVHSNIEKYGNDGYCPEQEPESLSTDSCFTPGLHPVTACRQNHFVCYTLGIHLGVLGALLSFIQILAICIALNLRVSYATRTPNQEAPAKEIVCLISNSLAADTMMCARLYLIIAFVIVSLSALYINWIRQIMHGLSWMCDLQLIRFCFFTNGLNCLDKHSVRKHMRHQQNFAFIALMHSLPWASAAGTALLIAFSFFTKQTDLYMEDLNMNKSTVNILFGGLNSLMSCSMKSIMPSDLRNNERAQRIANQSYTMTKGDLRTAPVRDHDQSANLQWIYPFLFIMIPIFLQFLFLFIYLIFIFRIRHRVRTISKSLRQFIAHKPLCIIILLVLIETLSSGIPVLKNFFPSIYANQSKSAQNIISRFIVIHLLADPWLLGCILHIVFNMDQAEDDCMNLEQINLKLSKTLSSQSKELIADNEPKPSNHLLPNSKLPSNISGTQKDQPMNLLNCFPLATQTAITEGSHSIGNRNFQPFLMSCLPTSGILVSTFGPHTSTNSGHDVRSYQDLNSPGFLYPIADSTFKIPPPVNTGTYHDTFQELNSKSTLKLNAQLPMARPTEQPSIIPLSIRNPNSTQSNDLDAEPETLHKTVQDIYPQLCQHHQRMLEQQQNQQNTDLPNTYTISKRARDFGSVPRFNQISINFGQSAVKEVRGGETTLDTSTNPNGIAFPTTTTSVTSLAPPSNSPSTPVIESGNYFHRSLSGKSTATAAVMAAAAAAVAAQAGSLPRALSHPTSTSSDTQETFPLDSMYAQQNPCDIVPQNSDLNNFVGIRTSSNKVDETHRNITE